MFNLIFKECKQLGKNLIYIIFICITIAFYATQYYSSNMQGVFVPPSYVQDIEKYYKENNRYPYGFGNEEIPEQVVPKAISTLYGEYTQGTYIAYPYGIIKRVRLNNINNKRIEEILQQVTGKSLSDLEKLCESGELNKVVLSSSMDYVSFKKLMEEVDNIIGGGSNYSQENLKTFGVKPITFEEAMKTYKDFIDKDKVSNGFARLFADYMGIIMGLFPIFIVVSFIMKDRKSNMKELIYSRGVSSTRLILSRYIALVVMIMVPVLVLAGFSTIQCINESNKFNIAIDYFAFFKYSIGWIMPTIMIVTAVGMLITLVMEIPIAIPIQIIWFFSSLFKGGVLGKYDLSQLMIRFNTIRSRDVFDSNIYNILFNRVFFVVISAIFVAISIYILDLKRMGRINFYDKFPKHLKGCPRKFKNSFSK